MRSWLLSSGLAALFLLGCCGQKSASDAGTSNERREAPEHNAPDQDRIDSLKEEKQKDKN
ncbi:MAG: hypothetical protein WAU70_00260 [Flavobacteriales bacterium]